MSFMTRPRRCGQMRDRGLGKTIGVFAEIQGDCFRPSTAQMVKALRPNGTVNVGQAFNTHRL
jgi:hypothetical protein